MQSQNKFKKGINIDVVRKISAIKQEPDWMLKYRIEAYHYFCNAKNPCWGPDLSNINFDHYIYFNSVFNKPIKKWEELPNEIDKQFDELKINKNDLSGFSGIKNQIDSTSIIHNIKYKLGQLGVIFCDIETAISIAPDIVKKYFGKLVPFCDNKYAALNTSVWSGGSFLYIPKNVKLTEPLQAYFRINTKSVGQFERTLIILEEGAQAHYIEGCTAATYDKNNLHASVVEVFVDDNAFFKYSTIQNWSDNVINLVTKRAIVGENGVMEWVDGNLGSGLNLKYPSTILKGDNSVGNCISIAIAKKGCIQDTGAKMFHIGKNTKSKILSKSISYKNGVSNYRGTVNIANNAENSCADISCDTLLVDNNSSGDTIPTEIVSNDNSFLKHEAKITKIEKEKMFCFNSFGIDDDTAKNMIVLGFVKPFQDMLPMEYAVELNRLIKAN